MIRRMSDKLSHLTQGLPKPLRAQLFTPLTPACSDHRASFSTERTSESGESKRADSLEELRRAEDAAFPHQRRQKGSYRLQDFYFQRTLGTGSFSRVHLGMSLCLLSCMSG
jgi:protein kinase A